MQEKKTEYFKGTEWLRKEAEQRYLALKFTDDFLFCKILEEHPDIAKELVELVLNRKIRKVVVKKQEAIELTSDGKGIRLDVYVQEEEDTIYDLEMQTTNKPNLPKRSRYYQGMIDLNTIRRGEKYETLRKTYIIFICMKDPFGYGNHIYSFENRCKEIPGLLFGDDTYKIILNASGTKADVSEKMMDFFEMLKTGRGKTALAQKIEREVERAKNHEEWRMEYMTLFMRDEEMKEEGRAEGRAEGVAGAILELLSELGPIPENIKNFIQSEKDLAVLNQWLKKAAKCKTIEEFKDFL